MISYDMRVNQPVTLTVDGGFSPPTEGVRTITLHNVGDSLVTATVGGGSFLLPAGVSLVFDAGSKGRYTDQTAFSFVFAGGAGVLNILTQTPEYIVA